MKRPKQLPAVDRNATKTAAVPARANVSPSWGVYDDLMPLPPLPGLPTSPGALLAARR
jgi:hypothetical protein